METIKVIDIAKMKANIKVMVENQRSLKNQRRTIRLVGERIMSHSDAIYKHQTGREDLRVIYAAYGIARGKTLSQIENHYPEEGHPLSEPYIDNRIHKLLKTYKTLELRVESVA